MIILAAAIATFTVRAQLSKSGGCSRSISRHTHGSRVYSSSSFRTGTRMHHSANSFSRDNQASMIDTSRSRGCLYLRSASVSVFITRW